jgi:L-lactate dehydrogenase
MSRVIGIIGMGWVGSSVAISTLHAGIAQELLVHDLRTEVAEGEAMDLAHGASFYPPCEVKVASIADMHRAQAIVVAVGHGSLPGGMNRLAQLASNAAIARSIGHALRGYEGVVVVVSNPVDVLTAIIADSAALPTARVIGTGTMLDTARLRQMVGQHLRIDARSVHAYVIGEHGDSETVLWSTARIGGTDLAEWPGWHTDDATRLVEAVRVAGYEIVRRKGTSNHAIGLVTAELLTCILRDERQVLTVSRRQTDVDGLQDVALSLPAIVGRHGATSVIMPGMADGERDALARSAQVIRDALASLPPA